MNIADYVLVAAGVTAGLHAGLLYDFSVDVVPSMRKLRAKAHIDMFHAIDRTITNPFFFISFFGPMILIPLGAYLLRGEPAFWWLVAASAVQILLCNVVTMAIHLPLNAELTRVDTSKISDSQAEKIRLDFQGPGSKWSIWHTVRTLAGTTATALVLVACLA